MLNRVRSLVTKELLQFTRDKLLLTITLLAPALELWLIGGGTTGGLSGMPVAVIDLDHSSASREVIAALDNTQELSVAYYPQTLEEADSLIDEGRISALVVVPERFGTEIREGLTPQVQLVIDGSNVVVAGEVQRAAQGAIETLGWGIAIASYGGMTAPRGIDLRQEALYNQALDSRPSNLTALMSLIIFEVVNLAAVMAIVREREIGTLEQVAITPVRQVELIAGKSIAPMVIGLVNAAILFIVVRVIFQLPMRGSVLLLAAMTVIYLISEICVALMISSVAQSQQQAITLLFIWIMVALTMSGYMVPISRLPLVLRIASGALPLRHYMAIVRSVMLKGAGLAALWPNLLALIGLDVVVIGVTSFMLRRLGR